VVLALVTSIERHIYLIRGQRVMLDVDLAALTAVPTKRLNEQVNRNQRFPEDFMFRLTMTEAKTVMSARSQFAALKRPAPQYLAYVFTEQGVAMLSSELNSYRSIAANIAIMRAFVSFAKSRSKTRNWRRSRLSVRKVFKAVYQLMETPAEPVQRPRSDSPVITASAFKVALCDLSRRLFVANPPAGPIAVPL
jgi:hypothetical protein